MKKNLLHILVVFLFLGCSDKEKIDISLNSWIGYAPLYSILSSEEFKDDINFVNLISLMESVKLYQNGLIDGFAGTYEEYKLSDDTELIPIILLDKSYGADSIFSNLSLDDLNRSSVPIDVYLEIESVNRDFFNDFIKIFSLEALKFNLINLNQLAISNLNLKDLTNPSILVSYEPYATNLKYSNFIEITSTKDDRFLIIDAIFVKKEIYFENKKLFSRLKNSIDRVISEIKANPKSVYDKTYQYFNRETFNDFNSSLGLIKWINDDASKDTYNTKIETKWLIK